MQGNGLTGLRDRAQYWNVTDAERHDTYPCDDYADRDWFTVLRGIDVDAPVPVTFRWVCQVKVAPYSYDWIDHRGRQSPRTLTPGAEHLAVGQPVMVGRIASFEVDHHITGVIDPVKAKIYGPTAMSYVVRPRAGAPGSSRLLACLRLGGGGLPRLIAREALLWGDLIMMRKQFLTLKACAEGSLGPS